MLFRFSYFSLRSVAVAGQPVSSLLGSFKTSISISNYRQTLLVSLTRVTSCLSRVKTNEPLISIFCVLMIFESGL